MATPKYRRHANGQAFVCHRSIARPQHRLYLGVHGSADSHRRYRAFIAGLAELDRGAPTFHHGATVGQAVAAWLAQPSRDRGTARALAWLESWAAVPCQQFGPHQLLEVQALLAGHYARSTANRHLARIRSWVRWGCLAGWFPADAWSRLAVVRGLARGQLGVRESPGVQPVAWSEVQPSLEFMAPPVAAMVQLQFWCGMRPGEVCRMRRADLDTRGAVWLYRPPQHKNAWRGQQLVKGIPPGLQPLVQSFFQPALDAWLFAPPGGRRGCYSPATYRHAVCAGLDRLGAGPRWTPAQLRHGIATELAHQAGIESAQRWLGHRKLATTEIYAARSVGELLEVAAVVDSLYVAQGGA